MKQSWSRRNYLQKAKNKNQYQNNYGISYNSEIKTYRRRHVVGAPLKKQIYQHMVNTETDEKSDMDEQNVYKDKYNTSNNEMRR